MKKAATSGKRLSHEPPAVTAKLGWRYHHIGIPYAFGRADRYAMITVTGPGSGSYPCGNTCWVFGSPGTYSIDVSAPGFVTMHRSIVVRGNSSGCGCPSADTQRLTLALLLAP